MTRLPTAAAVVRVRRVPSRSSANPIKGGYGLKKGLRGRFGMYVPPVLEAIGLAEVEHNPMNNRMRAIPKSK